MAIFAMIHPIIRKSLVYLVFYLPVLPYYSISRFSMGNQNLVASICLLGVYLIVRDYRTILLGGGIRRIPAVGAVTSSRRRLLTVADPIRCQGILDGNRSYPPQGGDRFRMVSQRIIN
jgi:hypothetical protein